MVTMADAVHVLFPAAVNGVDFVVQDDGQGPYLASWKAALGAQPTADQLAAVTQVQVDAQAAADQHGPAQVALSALRSPLAVLLRAVVATMVDGLNQVRAKVGLASLPAAQVRQAIVNHITAGDADS
jgi:hypothetical protein